MILHLCLAPVSRHGNWSVILTLENMQRRLTKIIKKIKRFQLQGKIRETMINQFTRNKCWSNWNFQNNGIFNYSGIFFFFNISLRTGNLLSRQIPKTNSTNKLIFFFCKWSNEVLEKINGVHNLNTELDDSEKMDRKRIKKAFLEIIGWIIYQNFIWI